ncbi:Translation initiation factor IF-1 [uncultured archaeon]|nr:Translation initiation factor IF-1 [uncultured archaeon]
MPRIDQVSITGTIVKALPNATWLVEIPGNQQISAYLGGKLRTAHIQIAIGDRVQLELSPYSLKLGRIVWRY